MLRSATDGGSSGVDLNEEYVAMAQKRLGLTVDNPEYVREDDVVGLEAFADD